MFDTKFKLSVDLIQLLKVKTVLGFTLRHCQKWFEERYLHYYVLFICHVLEYLFQHILRSSMCYKILQY